MSSFLKNWTKILLTCVPLKKLSKTEALESLRKRFHSKYTINPITECWQWQGTTDSEGYGVIWDTRIQSNKRAHRISKELAGEPIPNSLQTLHQCDNKGCVNPDHLHAGTNRQNIDEAMERGLLRNMSNKRKAYIQSLTDDEFLLWKERFVGKSGRALSNLKTAEKWRNEL
jgi:hypothetical protein